MILDPAQMTKEKDPKKAAGKCLESVGLDPDMYRIGHTKAGFIFKIFKLFPHLVFEFISFKISLFEIYFHFMYLRTFANSPVFVDFQFSYWCIQYLFFGSMYTTFGSWYICLMSVLHRLFKSYIC